MICIKCHDTQVNGARVRLGYRTCLPCGERIARKETHCVVPLPKSNYIVVTDSSLLKGLNSSHKGGLAT